MMSDEVGQGLAGEYELTEELGRGRSGRVFRARMRRGGAEVALKVMPYTPGSTAAARFAREVAIASRLRHQHIVPVLATGVAGGEAYAVMPLIEGGTVGDVLRTERVVPFERTAAIIGDAAQALDHAHGDGVLHGALTPEKLLVDHAGRCLVADFTCDTTVPRDEEGALVGALGSPGYMAPEQRRDSCDVAGQADQYSLAIIAYELLSGVHRVGESHAGEPTTFNPIDIARNRPLREGLPTAVNEVLRQALSKFSEQRFATCGEFASALVAARGQAVATPNSGPLAWLRTRGVKLLAATLLPPVAAVGIVMVLTEPGTWAAAATTGKRVGRTITIGLPELLTGNRAAANRASGGPTLQLRGGLELPVSVGPTTPVSGSDSATSRSVAGGSKTGGGAYRVPSGGIPGSASTRGNASRGMAASYGPKVDARGTGSVAVTVRGASTGTTTEPVSEAAGTSGGRLAVTVDRGLAIVVVDGLVRGWTPYAGGVAPGRHTVSVHSLGRSYSPSSRSIVVGGGARETVSFSASGTP